MWYFLFICSLLIPISLIVFGYLMWKKTPQEINYTYGYRTDKSMRNIDTWNYANKLCGKIMFIMGLIITIPTTIVEVLYYGCENNTLSIIILAIVGIQIILMLLIIPVIECSLNRKFDKDGNLLTR